jgi:mannitol/fructose-specific phosphotransferase system IIA component (Ntr-type)
MILSQLVRAQLVFPQLRADSRDELLRELSRRLESRGFVRKSAKLLELLLEREALGSTALGRGVAVPHCKMSGLARVVLAVAACPEGVEFGAEDRLPARLVFLVVSPSSSPADHLRALAAISAWVKGQTDLDELIDLSDAEELTRRLTEGPRPRPEATES